MMAKTHMTCGAMFAAAALIITNEKNPAVAVLGIGCAVLGSLMPDLDHPKSKISRSNILMQALSRAMSSVSSHRRFWHSTVATLLYTVIFFLLLMVLSSPVKELIIGGLGVKGHIDMMDYILPMTFYFFLGSFSHEFADAHNPQGAPVFWPIKDLDHKFHFPLFMCCNTQTMGETLYHTLWAAVTVILLLQYVSGTLDWTLPKL